MNSPLSLPESFPLTGLHPWQISPAFASPAFALILAGLVCAVIAATISLTINVPINTSQLAWNPQALPADWQQIRDRWQSAHLFRTAISMLGFAAGILAVLRNKD